MKAIVTCDIIKSRNYPTDERKIVNDAVRTGFSDCCDLITEAGADRLSFNIVQGDEFQFLINKPEYAYQFVVFFRLILAQTKLKPSFRAGIGTGEIINYENNIYEMDGSAFHFSRDAMELLQDKSAKDRITMIKTGKEKIDKQIDIIVMYNDFLEQNWSDKQREAIYRYKIHGSYQKASPHTDVTPQALHQRIQTAGWKQMNMGFTTCASLISSRLRP